MIQLRIISISPLNKVVSKNLPVYSIGEAEKIAWYVAYIYLLQDELRALTEGLQVASGLLLQRIANQSVEISILEATIGQIVTSLPCKGATVHILIRNIVTAEPTRDT